MVFETSLLDLSSIPPIKHIYDFLYLNKGAGFETSSLNHSDNPPRQDRFADRILSLPFQNTFRSTSFSFKISFRNFVLKTKALVYHV
ncbi:hypothetical protein A3D01_03190 [Candidatus Woesebacteria bacterium RIFCSPHIGHO2_02_FULL_39_13]|uniref:Uncharacterized protein n=1 Tax=Candidatus Woesebacteria bacterium RIFCSPHIGHO2_02_FULL_39_13 TaxID=1802505 RepID=A0A1F7Z501_9BACT|nr:MAG: hypothetical protein A3D01_03190 [Candidatus Woesebacteria bacterium RIFCSPHIGHO2_02_FULL_39_13]